MGLFDWLKKKDVITPQEETAEIAETIDDVEAWEQSESINIAETEVQKEATEAEDDFEIEGEVGNTEIQDNEETESVRYTADTSGENHEELSDKEDIQEYISEEAETVTDTEDVSEKTEEIQEESAPKGFFAKIKSGLTKTRNNIISSVENVLKSFTKIDEELYEELEEALIMADIGVETSMDIIEKLRNKVKEEKVHEVSEVKGLIVQVITEMMGEDNEELVLKSPSVVLVIGVNGVGKTTTIGKLTNNLKKQGKKVVLAAADTFRAAAIDQLEIWGERNGVDVIKHQENSDPGAVVFDAVQAAKARKADVLICDTAGRLHNKKNLMDELKKIFKIINREYPGAQQEVLLVLDATTGQNALQQAKLFKEAADITGIVLTKLDGTAKGGIVIAIKNELKIPVRFIGVGEGIDDLQPFDANDFAKALFDEE